MPKELNDLSDWVIGYCHIDSQWGRVPTQVRVRRPGSEGGMGGAESSRTQM